MTLKYEYGDRLGTPCSSAASQGRRSLSKEQRRRGRAMHREELTTAFKQPGKMLLYCCHGLRLDMLGLTYAD